MPYRPLPTHRSDAGHRWATTRRRTTRAALSLVTAVGAVGLVLVPGPTTSPAAAASTGTTTGVRCAQGVCTQTFTSDGSWSQPNATGDVTVVAAGGRGGYSGDGTDGGRGRALTLTSTSRSFTFNIGGIGADGDGTHGSAGGVHGGGNGGDASDGADGGGGGGATFLVDAKGTQVLIAAGGGGGGGGFANGDKSNGYEPRNFGNGGDAGLNGSGTLGERGQYQANAECPASGSRGGAGAGGSGVGTGGAGGKGGTTPSNGDFLIPGYGGGSGGGGAGGGQGGGGGCSNQSASGNGTDGSPGQGGNGGGNGAVGDCIKFGCTTAQAKNGGGGGGGGIFGGGGGGTGKGLAAGGGGGGASLLTKGVSDAGFNDGAGYLTFTWRYATPRLAVVGPTTLSSDSPGATVAVVLDVQGRQTGSGSAGKVYITDEYGDASTVSQCPGGVDGKPRTIANGSGLAFCGVKPTVDTTYDVFYEPSGQYAADGGGRDRQRLQIKVVVGKQQSLTSMATPGAFLAGDQIPLTATVTTTNQRPSGTVTFEYHDTRTDTWTLAGQAATTVRTDGRTGDASTTSTPLPSSADKVRATYDGNGTVQGSSSAPVTLDNLASLLTLQVSSTQPTYGDRLALTATAPGCTSGQVRFFDVDTSGVNQGTLLGSATIGTDHRADLTLTPSVGDLTISARGTSPCAGSDRNTSTPWQLVQTVAAPTTTAVDAAVRGDSAEVTVQVSNPARTSIPSGPVTVSWTTSSGTTGRASGELSGGTFTTTATDLRVGDTRVAVEYRGTSSYTRSQASVPVHVDPLPTTITLDPTPSTVPTAGVVPVTATVRSGDRRVQFGSVTVGGLQVEVEDGVARFDVPVPDQPGSSPTFDVTYGGTEAYGASATSFSVRVVPVAVTLTADQVGRAVVDGTVQLAVSVATTAAGASTVSPSGTVEVREQGSATGTPVPLRSCSSCQTRSGDVTLPAPAAGRHVYVVSYSDPSGRTSEASVEVPVAVDAAPVKKSVTFVPAGSQRVSSGQTVNLRALVRDDEGFVQSGTVTLYDGATEVVSGTSATAVGFVPTWVGTRTLSARYSGDATHLAATTDDYATVTVDKLGTELTVAATADGQPLPPRDARVGAGTPVTYTVALTSSSGAPWSGTVQLHRSDRPDEVVDVRVQDGVGSVTLSDLTPARTVEVHATYAGDATHEAASSSTLPVLVGAVAPPPPAATSVTPAQAAYSVRSGRDVTVPVAVSDGGGEVTGGSVELLDGDRLLARTTAGPDAVLVFTPGWTGTRTLLLRYLGDATHASSSGAVAVEVTEEPVVDPPVVDPPAVTEPTLTAVRPHRLRHGRSQVVVVVGSGFSDATRLLSPVPGVRVGRPVVVSSRRMEVEVSTGRGAALRPARWEIADGGTTYGCSTPSACDVDVISSPRVTDVDPLVLRRGVTTRVTLTGADFAPGMQAEVTGYGVEVREVRVRSAKRAVLVITTTAGAPLSSRSLRLTNDDGGSIGLEDAVRVRR